MVAFGASESRGGLRELVMGSGKACGGAFVDEAFFQFLRSKIPSWDQVVAAKPELFANLRREWDKAKRTLSEHDQDVQLDLPVLLSDLVRVHIPSMITADAESEEASTMLIPMPVVLGFFDDVLRAVVQLADEMVANVKTLYPTKKLALHMVGGFAECKYVQSYVRNHFVERLSVCIPDNPGSAIQRGACLYALNPGVFVSRRARKSYGTQALRLRLPDDEGQPVIMAGDKEYVSGFSAFVFRGQEVPVDAVVERTYLPAKPTDTFVKIPILSSDSANPKYPGDADVRTETAITIAVRPGDVDGSKVTVKMFFGGTHIEVQAHNAAENLSTRLQAVV